MTTEPDELWGDLAPNGPCHICGDPRDHDGRPHGEVTGDGRTRSDVEPDIDGVLEEWQAVADWTVGPDAMRSVPPGVEPVFDESRFPPCPGCGGLHPPGTIVMMTFDGREVTVEPVTLPLMPVFPVEVTEAITAGARAAAGALRAFGASAKASLGLMAALARVFGMPKRAFQYDEHHPRPLKIDGAAYHRRRRARARRRR